MKKDKTNQEAINSLVDALMDVEIMKTSFSPAIISHPFFSTGFQMNKDLEMVNILEDKESFFKLKAETLSYLHKLQPLQILFHVNTPYRLFFVRMAFHDLSEKDKGELLREAWITAENPNEDINVSHEDILYMFSHVAPNYVMIKEDYESWLHLPKEVTVYRGIKSNGIEDAYSWTLNHDVAYRFATRFSNNGRIISKKVPKESILAYFNDRDEQEVIIKI